MSEENGTVQSLETMKSSINTSKVLLEAFQKTSVQEEILTMKGGISQEGVDGLDLAHDTATLIRAYSTKLSLLIINKPFTATAINRTLHELLDGPLPGLASAVQICNVDQYPKIVSEELQWHAKRVFRGLESLVGAIPLHGQIHSDNQKVDQSPDAKKGSLLSTGVIWDACDAIIALKNLGIVGLVIKKVEEYRELIDDALEELREWGEGELDPGDENDKEYNVAVSLQESENIEVQVALDSILGSQKYIPKDDPDKIREQLDSTLKRLRLILLMYQAIIKRRLKALARLPLNESPFELRNRHPENIRIVKCLDELLDLLKKIPNTVDDLAGAFYELDGPDISQKMDECFFIGFSAVALLIDDWEGQKDGFSAWAYKFQVAIMKK